MRKKVKKNKILIKNLKIKKLYKIFKDKVFKNTNNENFALAVSGGSDSLCLAYFGKIFNTEFPNKMSVLIVDHKLRKESHFEALKVQKVLKNKKIESKILNWKGQIPKNNIQKNARNMRYELISKYCLKNKIKYLITAHHLDDQIENFFIRMLRGSGVKGLSSMSENVDYNDSLKIIRPFLSIKKTELEYVTLNFFKKYIKDPSNKNEKFLRVRIRKYRNIMEKEGLDTNKIIKTINNLLSTNKTLNFYKNKAFYKHVSFSSKDKCSVNLKILHEESAEIVFNVFSDILSLISGTYYPPRSKKIINLINRIKKTTFTKSTLGGCIIDKKDNLTLITKERIAKKMTFQLAK